MIPAPEGTPRNLSPFGRLGDVICPLCSSPVRVYGDAGETVQGQSVKCPDCKGDLSVIVSAMLSGGGAGKYTEKTL